MSDINWDATPTWVIGLGESKAQGRFFYGGSRGDYMAYNVGYDPEQDGSFCVIDDSFKVLALRGEQIIAPKPLSKHDEETTAASILRSGLKHLEDRAQAYDAEKGERSIGKTVKMFNKLYGVNLTEEQGWAFMALLKLVRSSQGGYRADSYEDGAVYMGLMGEAASRSRK